MELEDIIERCKKREQQAQSWLYMRYSRQMLRICYRYVADKQIAQDLMHDGFIVIFTSIHSLQQPEKVESWMGQIMTNLALRYINQTRSVSIISLSDLPEEQQPIDEELIPETLSLEMLFVMIDKLPEGYRNVFKLSTLDGLSHKEIAELLNIAPHSSSSQLYHAKEYLKKMIVKYHCQLLAFIILLIPICYLLFWKDTSKRGFSQPIAVIKETNRDTTAVKSDCISSKNKKKYVCRETLTNVVSLIPDTITSDQEEGVVDTLRKVVTGDKPKTKKNKQYNNSKHFVIPSTVKRTGWTFAFEYNGGRKQTNLFPKNFKTSTNGDITSSPIPPYTDNWNEYYSYLRQYGQYLEDQKELKSLMTIAQQNSGMIEEKQYHHLPFSVGVLLHKSLNKDWGIETGISYTRLNSDFKTGNHAFISERQKLHYIGIPLRGTYILGTLKQFSIYSSCGITVDIPVSGTLEIEYIVNEKVDYRKQQTLKAPLQWSINGGLGIQYQLTPSIGIFAEPNLHYYFNDGSSLKTIRKEHPFGFSLPIGIRFSY